MQQNKLETASVGRLLISLSIPMICAQLVTLLYNVVDRMFIGKMENGAMAMLWCSDGLWGRRYRNLHRT